MIVYIKRKRGLRQQYHFVIVANNQEVIATSENYRAKADCLHTATLLKNQMQTAAIVDTTEQ